LTIDETKINALLAAHDPTQKSAEQQQRSADKARVAVFMAQTSTDPSILAIQAAIRLMGGAR